MRCDPTDVRQAIDGEAGVQICQHCGRMRMEFPIPEDAAEFGKITVEFDGPHVLRLWQQIGHALIHANLQHVADALCTRH